MEEADEDAEVVVASSTYLSRTLGHHKDTPTFAPFMGRASMTQLRRSLLDVSVWSSNLCQSVELGGWGL